MDLSRIELESQDLQQENQGLVEEIQAISSKELALLSKLETVIKWKPSPSLRSL